QQTAVAQEQTALAKDRSQKLAISLAQVEAAEKKATQETRRLALTTGLAADGAWGSGQIAAAHEFLRQIPESFRGWEWRYRKRHFEGSYATLYGHAGEVISVAFSTDEQRLDSWDADGTAIVWDARTGTRHGTRRAT